MGISEEKTVKVIKKMMMMKKKIQIRRLKSQMKKNKVFDFYFYFLKDENEPVLE